MKKMLLTLPVIFITACSVVPSLDEVLTDNRTEYQKSEKLPPLEVPPDLSSSEANEAMVIPGENGENSSASLKDYKNRGRQQQAATTVESSTRVVTQPSLQVNTQVSSANPASMTAASVVNNGSAVAVRGDRSDVWLKLKLFLFNKGYTLDLDDQEAGVLVTNWSEDTFVEEGRTYRYQYKIFADPGNQPDVTMFYIDNLRQEQRLQDDGSSMWLESSESNYAVQSLAFELNSYFNGQQVYAGSSGEVREYGNRITATTQGNLPVQNQSNQSNQSATAEIQDVGDNKILLAIPEEYTLAWRHTEQALLMSGLAISSKDMDQGLYNITYQAEQESSGWTSKLKKLKFWGKDKSKGVPYQVALTGVGNKTELVLLNANGDWEDSAVAEAILSMIRNNINKL